MLLVLLLLLNYWYYCCCVTSVVVVVVVILVLLLLYYWYCCGCVTSVVVGLSLVLLLLMLVIVFVVTGEGITVYRNSLRTPQDKLLVDTCRPFLEPRLSCYSYCKHMLISRTSDYNKFM